MAKYTDAQKAEALAALQANNGNLSATSRDTGYPISTLKRWREEPDPRLADLGNQKRESLTERLEHIAYQLADAIPGKINEANLQHLSTSLGITIDKLRLLKGESTDISEVRGSDARERLAERIQRLTSDRPEQPN